jgi:integrase
MSIHKIKAKSGFRYRVKLRRPDGTQFSKTFRTKSEAKVFETDQINALHRGSWIDVRQGQVTFEVLASRWVQESTNKRQRTLDRDLGILKSHVFPSLGQRRISTIRKAEISQLIGEWIQSGLSPRTIKRHMAVVHAVFNQAVDLEMLGKNPASGVRLPKPEPVKRHPLSKSEATALLDHISPNYRSAVIVFLALGLRWSELAGLQVRDFDPKSDPPTLSIRRGLHQTSRGLVFEEPKSSAAKRCIPIPETLAKTIASLLESRTLLSSDGTDLLFVTPSGSPLNYSNFRNRIFLPALKAAGVSEVKIHDLRRTAATVLVTNLVDPKTIEVFMGHSDFRLTLTAYASATTDSLKRATVALEEFVNPGEGNSVDVPSD